MKRAEKRRYLDDYEEQRSRGESYFPTYALRDALAGLAVLLFVMLLSAWIGAPLDEKADPLATDYVPRPEWYFFFLFQLLKYFGGAWEVVGIVVIPLVATVFLVLLPFLDRSPRRHFTMRPIVTGVTMLLLIGGVGLTVVAVAEAPPPADAAVLVFPEESVTGSDLYITYCSGCHGEFGEGAANPTQPGDIIAPISTAEYLSSRTDVSIREYVAEGLPEFGMAAFEQAHGGPLRSEEVDAIVAHVRAWEEDPPVQLEPEVAAAGLSDSAAFLYPQFCADCHGDVGQGGLAPSLADPGFLGEWSDQQIFDSINLGHEATAMVAWGEVLTQTQIEGLVGLIRGFGQSPGAGELSYTLDVLPIFEVRCVACHGAAGGWDAATWEAAMTTGDNAPVVIPGDGSESILAQMMADTHAEGVIMPPDALLPDALVQLVVDWIEGGALE